MTNDFRRGVGIFLLNDEKKLWVGKRIDNMSDFWQMPQGGIDGEETPQEAMVRELGEEVGLKKNFQILEESEDWLYYKLPDKLKKKVWDGKYVGQKQKWFVCKFFGLDSEISLDNHKPEFLEWKWINPYESLDRVVPFKRKMYKEVLTLFKNHFV